MSRYDLEQRVRFVGGPCMGCTGITRTHYDPHDTESNEEVLVILDTSEKAVTAPARHLRPVVYGDFTDAT